MHKRAAAWILDEFWGQKSLTNTKRTAVETAHLACACELDFKMSRWLPKVCAVSCVRATGTTGVANCNRSLGGAQFLFAKALLGIDPWKDRAR